MSTKPSKPRARVPSLSRRRLTACIATARSGQRCKAAPMRGTRYCPLHTKGVAAKLGERGGRRRAIFDPDKLLHFEPPKSLAEVTTILGQIAVETHRGELDPRVASTLSSILNTLLAALEVAEQGDILRELERRTGMQDSMSQLRDEVTGQFKEKETTQ